MSKLTVREAAELTGKSRQTINDATKDGTLSFEKNGRGHKVIDVSELERVFDLIKQPDEMTKKSETVKSDSNLTVKSSSWEKELAAIRQEIQNSHERERHAMQEQIELFRKTLEETRKDKDTYVRLLEDHSSDKNSAEIEKLKKTNEDLEKKLQELLDADKLRQEERLERIKQRREQQKLEAEQSRGFFAKLFGS